MANQALINPNIILDQNGYPVPGAQAWFYQTGTLTAIPVYSDIAGTIATTNPVVADGNGVMVQVYVNVAAKMVMKDAAGGTLYTLDPVPSVQTTGSAASAISFYPTVFVPETTVQAAIELVDTNWRAATAALDTGKQDEDADLTAFATLSATGGMLAKLGANSYAVRTLTAGVGVTVANGDGVAGNPTFAAPGVPGAQFNYESAAAPAAFATSFTALTINATKKSGLGISLGSNQLTFATAGVYYIDADISVRNPDGTGRTCAVRLRNTTTSVTAVVGASMGTSSNAGTVLGLAGEFTVAAGNVLEVQGIASTTSLANGTEVDLGGEINVYSIIRIWRVS